MRNPFFWNIRDSWTPPVGNAPRWIEANAYSELTTPIQIPALGTLTLGALASGAGPTVPTWWISVSTPVSGSIHLFQKVLETLVFESHYLARQTASIGLFGRTGFDTAEPQYAWVAYPDEDYETLEVRLSDGTWRTVARADSEHELFTSGEWKWKEAGGIYFVYGLDLVETTTTVTSGWQFVSNGNRWDRQTMAYLKRPYTDTWQSIGPEQVRSDGFLSYYWSSGLPFRSHLTYLATGMDEVQIRLGGVFETTATRVDLTNSLDYTGLVRGVSRRPDEPNAVFADSLRTRAEFVRGESGRSITIALSDAFRLGTRETLTVSGSTLAMSGTGTTVAIFQTPQTVLFSDVLFPVSGSADTMLSRVADPEEWELRQFGFHIDGTRNGSVYTPATAFNRFNREITARFLVSLWSVVGQTITFTDNFDTTERDIVVYRSNGVELELGSEATRAESFTRSSPSGSWGGNMLLEVAYEDLGIAVFD